MKKLILSLLVVSISISSYGQITDWLMNINSDVNDVAVDGSGNVYIVGDNNYKSFTSYLDTLHFGGTKYVSPNLPFTGHRAFVTKLSPSGQLLWCKTIAGGNFLAKTHNVQVDNLNNVIFSVDYNNTIQIENDTTISSPGVYKTALVKYDQNGNFEWINVLAGNPYSQEWPSQIEIDIDNNIYIDVDSAKPAAGGPSWKGEILKYRPNGQFVGGFIRPASKFRTETFAVDELKNVYLSHSSNDTFMIVYDSNMVMTNVLMSSSNPISIYRMDLDSNNNLYALAHGSPSAGGNAVVKFDSSLNISWSKPLYTHFYKSQSNWAPDLKVKKDGEIFISAGFWGGSFSYDSVKFDATQIHPDSLNIIVLNLNKDGNIQWGKLIEGDFHNFTTGLIHDGSDNVYTCGYTYSQSIVVDHLNSGFGGFLLKIIDGNNLISGKVYIDSNSNGSPDAGDRFIPWAIIDLDAKYKLMTNSEGEYKAYVLPGNYNITLASSLKYFTSSPSSHNATFTSIHQKDTTNHFALTQTPNMDDLQVFLTASRARVGRDYILYVHYNNVGSTTQNARISLEHDDSLTFKGLLTPPIDTILSNAIKINVPNLKPLEGGDMSFRFDIGNVVFGGSIYNEVVIGPLSVDNYLPDNYDSLLQTVWNSYDPNDKAVLPEGDVNPQYVKDGNYFIYTVRFQNTGNDTAFVVRIRDSISNNLDLNTLESISSSHDFRMRLWNPNAIDWIFEDINLVDSGSSYTESQGFVKYRIKAKTDLTHGDFINNTAYIFFDDNEAVVTNTVRTDISDWAGITENKIEVDGIYIYPNPTNSEFNIVLSESSKSVDIRIMDISGRIVYSKENYIANIGEVKISDLNVKPGIYFVEVIQDEQRFSSKLIVN